MQVDKISKRQSGQFQNLRLYMDYQEESFELQEPSTFCDKATKAAQQKKLYILAGLAQDLTTTSSLGENPSITHTTIRLLAIQGGLAPEHESEEQQHGH
jgi:hypothetical protein